MPFLKTGDLVDVEFLERANRAAFFDVPHIGLGVVYGIELLNAKRILKKAKIGETLTAKVVEPENKNGLIELSLAEAGRQKVWQELKDQKDQDEAISVKVVNANSGGLLVDLNGIQGFLPASHLSNEHYPQKAEGDRNKITEELKKLIDETLTVKVISINPRTNKLIVSEREVISENVKELLEKYKEGDIVAGIVSGVANFGAFIRFADVPQIEGLIHISELDHRLIDHPKEVVIVGDLVKAKIVEIKDGRVSLSLKALQADPWENIEEKFSEGMFVQGLVYKFNPFGAFIKLEHDILGLIHVSEFGSLDELKQQLKKDETYEFVITSIKPTDKRIVLKLKKPAVSETEVGEKVESKKDDVIPSVESVEKIVSVTE
ncbi:MAG: S1 RNA-binding domain-containing protein [bacterium]